jgi:hypothetical protein
MRYLVLALSSLAAALSSAAEPPKACPVPYEGRYANYNHYYAFDVPAGIRANRNASCGYDPELKDCMCFGDHGLHIPLPGNAVVAVYSDFPLEVIEYDPVLGQSSPSKQDILDARVARERSEASTSRAIVTPPESVEVKGNRGVRTYSEWTEKGGVAMRRVTYWMVSTQNGYPDATVRISLQSPTSDFQQHLPVLDKVLGSFQWNPKSEE